MKQCKQLENFYTEYVSDLLDEEQVARIEEHLRDCSACAHEIEALQKTLRLTDEVAELPIPSDVLDNIEMNVYKRLAAESPANRPAHLLSRVIAIFRSPGEKRRPAWIFRSALATLALVIGISVATVFINQDQSTDIPIQPSYERIELYRQAEIRNSQTEALETRHLKGDDRLATLQLLVLEQSP